MPLTSLEHSPPPLFNQGPSAFSRLIMFSALALFLMVADARFQLMQPLRAAIATALYPLQWLALQPVRGAQYGAGYFVELRRAQHEEGEARRQLAVQAQRAAQVELLGFENTRLRELLDLKPRLPSPSQAAEVLYDATDPYTRRVVINKGQAQGVQYGAPVLDGAGVLGQVTRVYPLVSEVTLLIDRDQAIPLLNTRNGIRGVAYGEPTAAGGGQLDLRYMPAATDIRVGDEMATSGLDGVYPPGLRVAEVASVERRSDSSFARIRLQPYAQGRSVRYVLVLEPQIEQALPDPATALPLPPLPAAPTVAANASAPAPAPAAIPAGTAAPSAVRAAR